jgi:Holliday junction resolvase-like predicted endonuclease
MRSLANLKFFKKIHQIANDLKQVYNQPLKLLLDVEHFTHLAVGKLSEEIALSFLKSKQCHFIAKNYYQYGGEIDLITLNNRNLLITEVKSRIIGHHRSYLKIMLFKHLFHLLGRICINYKTSKYNSSQYVFENLTNEKINKLTSLVKTFCSDESRLLKRLKVKRIYLIGIGVELSLNGWRSKATIYVMPLSRFTL